ncbi:chemotaxis protein CheW [Thiocystis violacea]|uniref:chemotaxis protein CheW n=1 Tax=Thiocystis violacea TaxID=13725 RepID=UPI0019074D5E|nr:chemotaxis protein CheW [Thiocystis violacea]
MSTQFSPIPDPVAALSGRRQFDAVRTAPQAVADGGQEEVLGFTVGPFNLACALESVAEVAEVPVIFPIPHLPDCLVGTATLHGKILPVADLTALLGFPSTDGKRWLMVAGRSDEPLGVLVDGLPDTLMLNRNSRLSEGQAALHARLSDHVVAAYDDDGVLRIVVALESLLEAFTEQSFIGVQ